MKYGWLAIILLLLLTACPNSAPEFWQVGSIVVFDPGRRDIPLVKAEEYHPFVWQYPKDWPKRFVMPQTAHLSHEGKIYETTTEIDGVQYRTYAAELVVKGKGDRGKFELDHFWVAAQKYYEMEEVSGEFHHPRDEMRGDSRFEGGSAGIRQLQLAMYGAKYFGDWWYGEIRVVLY